MRILRTPALVLSLVFAATGIWTAQYDPPRAPGSMFFESFSGGIPATWSIVDGYNDGVTWATVDPSIYHLGAPFSSPASAIMDSDRWSAFFLDEQLISPPIDVAACTAPVYLNFGNVFKNYAYNLVEVGEVDVSADGGATWTNKLRMTGNDYGPELKTLFLAPYPRDYASLKIRFHYYNARDEFWWLVDNLDVYCFCPGDQTAPGGDVSPSGGSYSSPQLVTLSCQDTGGCGCKAIHYTLDGSDPTTSSPVYAGPITISENLTLKFFATDFNDNRSATAVDTYVFETPVRPVASAGAAQTVHIGTTVTLDGSGSGDPDGNYPLTYDWTLFSAPAGSHAALTDPTSVSPSFVADTQGDYTIRLSVRDATGLESDPSTVIVSTTNSAPTADAGQPQTVPLNTTVTLTGTASDPDGDAISAFAWTLTHRPTGSTATLSAETTSMPTISPDVPGDYTIALVVTDCWGRASAPSSVTISTVNAPPVADGAANPLFVAFLDTVVNLSAAQSYDPDGDEITYLWAFKTNPSSAATIDYPEGRDASFVADTHGDYVIELTVTDCWGTSHTATLTVSFGNLAPTADPGVNQSVETGVLVSLDGSGSFDPNRDPLTYRWSLLTKPTGSTAELVSDQTSTSSFTADVDGAYTVQLIVNDGLTSSEARTLTVTATSLSARIVQSLTSAVDLINTIDASAFKNKNMRNTLTTKINVVIEQIRQEQYAEAADKLQNDVLAKVNGCGLAPDNNDWVIRCQAQCAVRSLVLDALNVLKGL